MLIVCPSCATAYNVDVASLQSGGRQVRCVRCGKVWHAEATPADKFTWRPAPGVRSTGEVFMHVVNANYHLPTFWGAKASSAATGDFEKQAGDKAKTVAALKDSFEYAQSAMAAVPDSDLGRAIKIFGRDATVGDAMLGLAAHAHEHLGQSIAYARVNGIVPPWSEKDVH